MTLEGIDVSRWQGTTPSLTGKAFLFARATYGTFVDAMYATHVANAKAAGLVTGAYHFGRSGNVPGQVAVFLARAHDADLLALDLESDGAASMSLGEAQAFIVAVHASGRQIGLYHSDSGFPHIGQDWDWVANWSHIPARPWTFWQYRGSPLDLDKYNGTLPQLRALAGQVPVPQQWEVHIPGDHVNYRPFTVFHVSGNHVTSTRTGQTRGMTVNCKAPADFLWAGHATQRLAVLTSGGLYLKAKALGITVAVRGVYARPK